MKSSSVSEGKHEYKQDYKFGGCVCGLPLSSRSHIPPQSDNNKFITKDHKLPKLPPQSGKSSQGNDYPEPKYATKGDKLNSESGKEWESIAKLSIIDENEGTITFSYNELVNLLEGK